MAQFRNTQDLVDAILRRSGELTDGTSDYESDALLYANDAHHSIIAGGTVIETDVDEIWPWSKAKNNIVLELQPKESVGTISVTLGSESATLSDAPSQDVTGWFLKVESHRDWIRIGYNSGTALELDSNYTGATGAAGLYKIVKLDYEMIPQQLIINSDNDKFDFQETLGTNLAATIVSGTYLPSELATALKTALEAVGGSVYTVTYDTDRRKYTLASDGAGGGGIFSIMGGTGPSGSISSLESFGLQFEDLTAALTYTADNPLGAVSKLVEPFRVYRTDDATYQRGTIMGTDALSLMEDWPMNNMHEGVPNRFAVLREDDDGLVTVRFNRYPKELTRVDIEYVAVPGDLKNTPNSIPLVPRKYMKVLEFFGAFFIMLDKEDSKAPSYSNLCQQQLRAMMGNIRRRLSRTGEYFGAAIPRRDKTGNPRRLLYGEPEDS